MKTVLAASWFLSLIGLLFLLGDTSQLNAQTEFLVEIDPETGAFTHINCIPDLHWITTLPYYTGYDEDNQRYFLRGSEEDQSTWYLYSVDGPSGELIHQAEFPQVSGSADNVISPLYDDVSDQYYGLHWNDAESTEYFVSIDPVTGVHTILSSLSDVNYIAVGTNTMNSIEGHYIFQGVTFSGENKLYSIDISTGEVVHEPDFPQISGSGDNVGQLRYNSETGILYGLHWDSSEATEYLVTVDPVTGVHTNVAAIPGVNYLSVAPSYTTLDEFSNRYTFLGGGSSGTWRLYTLDLITGDVLYEPIVSYSGGFETDNVICPHYDDASGTLYALHWDADFPPDVLGDAFSFCEGSSITLDASTANASAYLWQDGASTPSNTISEEGANWVDITVWGCTFREEFNIEYIDAPFTLDMGEDKVLCPGDDPLEVTLAAGGNYTWHDGTTANAYTITEAGTYWVEMSWDDCTIRDSLLVSAVESVVLFPDSIGACEEEILVLDATVAEASDYLWQDGSTAATFEPDESGLYWAEVTLAGCAFRDSVQVVFSTCDTLIVDPDPDPDPDPNIEPEPDPDPESDPSLVVDCGILVPNAFTPNYDGVNDLLNIQADALGCTFNKLRWSIFNRWGEEVHRATSLMEPWDGFAGGSAAPLGVYAWVMTYEVNGISKRQQGQVILLR